MRRVILIKTYRIIHGDAYQEIKKIPDNSIDLILTDPPYDIPISKKKIEGTAMTKSYMSLMQELTNAGITNSIDYNILNDFVRVMKTINIYIWCNKKQIPYYLDFFVNKHMCKYEILVWIKSNPIPCYGNNYLNDKEYCLYFRKNKKIHTTYDSGHTYWITPTNKKDKKMYGHPTIKPQAIIEDLILNSSDIGDIVFDPFLGSGTTAAASLKLGRRCIGIESNLNYYSISEKRVAQVELMN